MIFGVSVCTSILSSQSSLVGEAAILFALWGWPHDIWCSVEVQTFYTQVELLDDLIVGLQKAFDLHHAAAPAFPSCQPSTFSSEQPQFW